MKAWWRNTATRIDRLTLRQSVGLFGACAFFILYLTYMLAFDPLLREQARVRAQISQQHAVMAGVDTDMTKLVEAFARDPDAGSRERLARARAETITLGASLAAMRKGLVAPEQMGQLLQTILRANGRLQLVALTTLPVSAIGGAPAPAPGTAATAAVVPAASGLLYRHGVQLTLRGSYLDMIDYMAALERLPTRLFWGPAQFEVEEYPRAHVTLTLYTLSLDSQWLKL